MVTPLDASPTYELDGWAGNTVDEHGVAWIVTQESGWSDGAPVRLATADREGTDGGISGPVLRGARLITLTGVAVAPNQAAMLAAKDRWRAFAASSPSDTYSLVVTEAHMARQAQVKLSDAPKAKDSGPCGFAFELILRADDPVWYAAGEATVITAGLPPSAIGGLTFPIVFPLTFGAGGDEGAVFATNLGTAPVWPVLTITGPVDNPSVHNITADRQLSFDITLAADEWLVVDTARNTVLLNGTANRFNTLLPSSVWWQLAPGSNELRYVAAAYTASQLTVTYRSGWR